MSGVEPVRPFRSVRPGRAGHLFARLAGLRRIASLLAAVIVLFPPASGAWERDLTAPGEGRLGHFHEMGVDRSTTVEVHRWMSPISGDLSIQGLNIDLEGGADFDTRVRSGFRLTHSYTPRDNLILAFNSFEHTGRIWKPFTFRRRSYNALAFIDLRNAWVDLGWAHLIAVTGRGGDLRSNPGYLEILAGLKYSEIAMKLKGFSLLGAYQTGSWSDIFPVPYIGIGGGSQLTEHVWIDGHLKYFAFLAGNGDVKTLDGNLTLALRLNPRNRRREFHGTLGYRSFFLSGNSGTDHVKTAYKGPTFGLVVKF